MQRADRLDDHLVALRAANSAVATADPMAARSVGNLAAPKAVKRALLVAGP